MDIFELGRAKNRTRIEELRDIEQTCKVDVHDKVEHPPVALSYKTRMYTIDGVRQELPIPIGTEGNFSFVQAPPKSFKTYFASLCTAAYLNGTTDFTGDMLGHRNGKAAIHFDTEQSKFHSQMVFKRALNMSGDEHYRDYHTFALRPIDYKDRVDFIEYYLHKVSQKQEIGFVIIDGLADLVSDVNQLDECNACVQKVMEWTFKYRCHIMTVIHSNYGSEKPTGHLGSALEKKTESQIKLELSDVNDGQIDVKCRRSRNFPFETFSYKINELDYPEVIGDVYDLLEGIEFQAE
jgi:hypothetical protein